MLKMELDEDLQNIAHENYEFKNWAKTFSCHPELLFTPKTELQVVKVVQLAKRMNKRIKVFGSGHSPSDLACTTEFLVNIDHMDGLLSVNKEKGRVTVQAGMSLHKLHVVLKENNLALSNLGSISDQSVAGVMATASHGTGAHFGCLSTLIVDMTMVTADGDMVTCSSSEHTELFNAAKCNLGCLGIVTRVTLQTEPAFRLEAIQRPYKFPDVLNDWDATIHSAEHVRVWWYPHTDDCVVWRANRTDKPKTIDLQTMTNTATSWWCERVLGFHIYQGLLNLTRYQPAVIPTLTQFMFNKVHSRPLHVVDDSHKIFNFDCLFPQYVNEWAIDWDDAPAALRQLDRFIKENNLKVHFPVEIRFVDQDDIWLSPAYGRKTCYIGVIMYR
ncbi:D-arabinono-1,4-lactone oxidase-domain-containing protein [Halteromyces radiatus]|uniref:D-arabinono-1,4-lactone oxidase-domain-containing protein n=1 Tax=Halteromyces radiatus TaxID=101107 RepID=UPI00221FDFD9|nr:D-arabinono-1,4-lactone oxidase-domain-containing protein [Halteromyces radiatus]KAI8099586.1 D-arabinono-1,4-lactone oxidase-domain-containing protein [Halteromyces radiatus]